MFHGRFSTLGASPMLSCLSPGKRGIAISSWNGRAVLAQPQGKSFSLRNKKLKEATTIIMANDVTVLQEVHGSPEEFWSAFSHMECTHYIFFSAGLQFDAGGTATFCKKASFHHACTFGSEEIVPGRVTVTTIDYYYQRAIRDSPTDEVPIFSENSGTSSVAFEQVQSDTDPFNRSADGARTMDIFNIHNHDLARWQSEIKAWLEPCLKRAQEHPCEYACALIGDFNHIVSDELSLDIVNAELSTSAVSHVHSPCLWRPLLSKLVEIRNDDFSHFNSGVGKINRLSRLFVSMPPWMCLQFSFDCFARDPVKYFEAGLSDHAPTTWRIMAPEAAEQRTRSIPSHVTRSSIYKQFAAQLVAKASLDTMIPAERYEQHKTIIYEAARLARDHLTDRKNLSEESKLQIFSTCARCVVQNLVSVALNMLVKSEIAQTHIYVEQGKVKLRDPNLFSLGFSEAKLAVIETRQKHLCPQHNNDNCNSTSAMRKRKRSQMQALLRMASLWKASLPCMNISGVLMPSGSIARSPDEKSRAYRSYWGPVFDKIQLNSDEISSFAKKFIKPWNLGQVPPPGERTYATLLDQLEDCGVGPDGLPYSAWNVAQAPRTLFLLGSNLQRNIRPKLHFNSSKAAFLKKKDHENDAHEIIRHPKDTRPLGLRNSDNKLICAASNRAWRRTMPKKLSWVQRGFCYSRQLVENVVDVDSDSRTMSNLEFRAFLALWDFECAFPSVGHLWLFTVLEAYGFPFGFICLVKSVYFMCFSYQTHGGSMLLLWVIRSGVLQGCPLSGLLFSIVMDPFARAFERLQASSNLHQLRVCVRLCADDVGAALANIHLLKSFHAIFLRAKKLANLSLKTVKCILVPLFNAPFESIVRQAKAWLLKNIPDWYDFTFATCAEYLGFMLGPTAGSEQLAKVKLKWMSRCNAIHNAGTSMAVNILAYNVYAHSCWGYKCQLMHLGDDIFKEEKRIVSSILKIPHQSFGAHLPFDLSHVGLPELRSLRVLNIASLARASNMSLKSWLPGFHRMVESAEKNLSPHSIAQQHFCNDLWDSVPFACNLWLYHASNPLAWQHLAYVRSVDAKRGLVSVIPNLGKSWQQLASSCDPALKQLHDALNETHKYQRSIYRLVKPLVHPVNWSTYVHERLKAFCVRHDLDCSSLACFDWESWAVCLQSLSPFTVSHVLRTLFNSWITSARISCGSSLFKCFFCGNGSDCVAHYLSCSTLWEHMHRITGIDFRGPAIRRLGVSTDKLWLSCIAFVSYFYHSIRGTPTSCGRLQFHIKAFNYLAKTHIPIVDRESPCNCKFGIKVPYEVHASVPEPAAEFKVPTLPIGPTPVPPPGPPSAPEVPESTNKPDRGSSAAAAGRGLDLPCNDHLEEGSGSFLIDHLDVSGDPDNWEALVFEALGFSP
jgi:hypothetical protein